MSAQSKGDRLSGTTWIHVFEEDTGEGSVYRPEEDDIPLSRRPRERIELQADGSARVFVPGPDDRYVEQQATWSDEKGAVVIRKGSDSLRVIHQSPSRLIIRTEGDRA